MFHVKNRYGETSHVNEAIVHGAIARELGLDQIEPTIREMKYDDVRFGDGRGNVYWHEWAAAEMRFANHDQAGEKRAREHVGEAT